MKTIDILAVGIGGAMGAALRYMMYFIVPDHGGFPFATWLVNMIGCFCLSYLLAGNRLANTPTVKIGLTAGLLGAFTTFSTFSAENIQLIERMQYGLMLFYTSVSILLGVFSSFIGYYLAKRGDRT